VSAENTGSPVEVTRLERGYPKATGALPGASGAQFIGKLIHDPHQNQQDNQFIISCKLLCNVDAAELSKPISSICRFGSRLILIMFLFDQEESG
jgi:hypothetical protein